MQGEVEISSFSQTEMEQLEPALLKNGAVVLVTQYDECRPTSRRLYYSKNESALEIEKYTILIGTSPNDLDELFTDYEFKPNTKYYWKLADTHSLHHDHKETDVRCFYYMEPYEVKAYYPGKGGDWAVVLKWDNNSAFEGGSVTMTPHKDCNYDKTPIEVPVGQDSCYISAGSLGNQKYQIYHNWCDEANGKYYEPVVYDFKVTMNYNLDSELVPVPATAEGIFLNIDGYVADSQYNVYRYAKIGNRTWMLDDLRAIPNVEKRFEDYYRVFTLKSGLDMVLYEPTFYEEFSDMIIPKGFHLATNDDLGRFGDSFRS